MSTQPQIHPQWKQAVNDVLTGYTYGDVIPHQWIQAKLGYNCNALVTPEQVQRMQLDFLSQFESFKSELLTEHSIYLTNVRGIGYMLVKPDDQSEVVWSKLEKAIRKALRAGHKGLTNIRYDLLNGSARNENTDKLNKLASLRVMNRKQLK